MGDYSGWAINRSNKFNVLITICRIVALGGFAADPGLVTIVMDRLVINIIDFLVPFTDYNSVNLCPILIIQTPK
jgi:hypothetical protein